MGGGTNDSLTFLLDGGTHNDAYTQLNLPLPFPDALQEFKVETSAVPAQYGQHAGGAINVVTKSGTNQEERIVAGAREDRSAVLDVRGATACLYGVVRPLATTLPLHTLLLAEAPVARRTT